MGKKIISISLIVVVFLTIIVTPIKSTANMSGYLDNIVNSVQELSPDIYKGQQRTYLVGGSVTLRNNNQTQPLVSFTPPRIKAGCGGIDVVMGGFSYLNFEYLVQKLQAILQAAPAFAFRLALKTLTPEIDDIIASLEAIADMINSINVDNCKGASALVGYLGEMVGLTATRDVREGTVSSFFKGMKDNLNSARDSVKKFFSETTGKGFSYYACVGSGQDPKTCASTHGAVNFTVPLLTQVFKGIPDFAPFKDFENITRAYLGDVYQELPENISDPKAVPQVLGDPGCADAESEEIVEALVKGRGYIKTNPSSDQTTYCQQLSPEGEGLAKRVKTSLEGLKSAIEAGSEPNTDQIMLVNISRYPIYRIMSLAVLYQKLQGDDQKILSNIIIEKIAEPIAYDIANQVVSKLHASVRRAITATKATKSSSGVPIPQGAISSMESIETKALDAITASDRVVREKWVEVRTELGDAFEVEARMLKTIYTHLAKAKLLDSYMFAKGMR